MKQENMRALALETLLAVEKEERQSHVLIREVLDQYAYLPEYERAFYRRLVTGTLENRLLLDEILGRVSAVPVRRLKPAVREILRMTVYQLRFMDSVPDAAAVNEAVRLTVRKGFGGLRGFVNGVLRAAVRVMPSVAVPEELTDPETWRLRYSMPPFLTEKWANLYGPEATGRICRSFSEERRLCVRVRTAVCSAEEAVRQLKEAGIDAQPSLLVPEVLVLTGAGDISRLGLFQEGALIVQDPSSVLAVQAAHITPGMTVIDVCASPGGKSILAADLAGEDGHVLAGDITSRKAERIRENAARCRVTNLEAVVRDASLPDPAREGSADAVLADVPCSGYGVIGRKPEIRYRASAEKEASLVRLQRQILSQAARLVRPGGVLVFSTCTVNRAENEDNLAWLARETGLVPENPAPYLPEALRGEKTLPDGYLQLLPGVHPCDGFFFARLRREHTDEC